MSEQPGRRLERSAGARVFGADIAGYHSARLGYPTELYDRIAARSGIGVDRALEIGPGTGLATRDILDRLAPAELVAVEPDAALAAHLPIRLNDSRLKVVQSGFVEASLDGGFDLACVAAAFHWLEPGPAFAKLRQVLRPGATLALWWNTYRQPGADAFADAVTPLLAGLDLAPSEGSAGHYSLDETHHRDAMSAAGFTGFAPFVFRRERVLSTDQLRDLYASYSYVRALDRDSRQALLDAIGALADNHFGGQVRNVVLTALYIATAPGPL